MELYEGASQRPVDLWATGSVKDLSEAPVSSKIEGSEFYFKPGSKKNSYWLLETQPKKIFIFLRLLILWCPQKVL